MRFANRQEAGRRLADDLASRSFDDPVVFALPRGGVPVAAEIASRLRAPLDVLVVRKLGHPLQPELGLGAVTEDGTRILNQRLIAELSVLQAQLDGIAVIEQAEADRRVACYRGGRPPLRVAGRTVILVDDGLATGFTARAAIEWLRRQHAGSVVLAVPVGAATTVRALESAADQVICLQSPTQLRSIGRWYADFWPVQDADVARILAEHAAVRSGRHR